MQAPHCLVFYQNGISWISSPHTFFLIPFSIRFRVQKEAKSRTGHIFHILRLSSAAAHIFPSDPIGKRNPSAEEIVAERKGASVGGGPAGQVGGLAETPSKKRSGGGGSGKKEKGGGAHSAGHSIASPSPPPPLPANSSPQPSLATTSDRPTEVVAGEDHPTGDYRVAMFGAGGVGKSALVQRFIKNTFSDAYVPTIEDTYQQVITCSEHGRLAVCTLHIIDTTGSHQFPAMQRLAMQRGHAFVLVYSISSRQSLEDMGPIVRTLREVKGETAMADVPVVLVGNKSDEQSARREVATETGEALAQRWGCAFLETSAKQGRNVTELFQRLLSLEKRRHLTLNAPENEGGGERDGSGSDSAYAKQRRCTLL